jgi:hypothetical protein
MKRLALVLGIVFFLATSSSAALLSEDFESYAAGASIAGANGWAEIGRGEWFQANAATPSDPAFLQTRYADLSNNGHNPNGDLEPNSWLYRSFASQNSGVVTMAFNVLFELGGQVDSCNIYLSDGDKTPAENNYNDIAAAVTVGTAGLRVHDGGGWRVVENISIKNDTWYRFTIGASLDLNAWGLLVAEYSGETLGAAVAASYNGSPVFGFRDGTIDDIGMLEFMTHSNIMSDAGGEGFLVDNIYGVPEPASAILMSLGAIALLRRRKSAP